MDIYGINLSHQLASHDPQVTEDKVTAEFALPDGANARKETGSSTNQYLEHRPTWVCLKIG